MVRVKHRYLLLNFLYPDAKPKARSQSASDQDELPWIVQFRRPSSDLLDARLLIRMIRDRVADMFGDFGSGIISASLQVKYLSTATSVAIVRVARAQYKLVWAALTFTTRIPKPVDQACVIQVVRVSGTIKKAEEDAIRRARSMILLARRTGQASALGALDSTFTASDAGKANNGGDLDTEMTSNVRNPEDSLDESEDEDD